MFLFFFRRMPPTSCSTSAKTRSASPPSLHPYPPPPIQSTTLLPRPRKTWTEPLPVSAWRRTDIYIILPLVTSAVTFYSASDIFVSFNRIQQKLEPLPLLPQEMGARGNSLSLRQKHHGVGTQGLFLLACHDKLKETGLAGGGGGFRDRTPISALIQQC